MGFYVKLKNKARFPSPFKLGLNDGSSPDSEQVERLRKRAAELEQALRERDIAARAKDEFLATLAHELRNPLAPVVHALQIMRLRGAESREQDILARQLTHLTRLVDDLLDVSRIERGRIELSCSTWMFREKACWSMSMWSEWRRCSEIC